MTPRDDLRCNVKTCGHPAKSCRGELRCFYRAICLQWRLSTVSRGQASLRSRHPMPRCEEWGSNARARRSASALPILHRGFEFLPLETVGPDGSLRAPQYVPASSSGGLQAYQCTAAHLLGSLLDNNPPGSMRSDMYVSRI